MIGITDLLDGWIARKWDIATPLGGDLDKFADKLYACSIFAYFLKREIVNWEFSYAILVFVGSLIALILFIELVLIIIWIIGFFKQLETKSHIYGKIKMAIQFIALGYWFFIEWIGSLIGHRIGTAFYFLLIPLFLTAAIFGCLSVLGYLQRYINSEEKED